MIQEGAGQDTGDVQRRIQIAGRNRKNFEGIHEAEQRGDSQEAVVAPHTKVRNQIVVCGRLR